MRGYGMFYDKSGEPIDLWTWAGLIGDMAYKRVARTTVLSAADPTVAYDVSTVWLGTDHNFVQDGPPIIFETMVFGDDSLDLAMDRYPSEELARRGHDDMVTTVAATIDDPVLMDAVDAETMAHHEEQP